MKKVFSKTTFSKSPGGDPFIFSDAGPYLKSIMNNALDMGEDFELVHDFEIEIHLQEMLSW